MCEYAYYNKNKQLYCKLNDKMCLFSKYCMKQNKYIHREGADNCYMALEESKRKIPNDACYVRFVRKGFVYVEIGDKVIKIKDTLGNIENYVYISLDKNGEYKISLSPIEKEVETQSQTQQEEKQKKRQYNRKKK